MGIANPADSPSANTTAPPARPYAMPALNGLYFPVLQTSNLTTSSGLANAPAGLVASVAGKTGTGTLSFPTLDTTKPFRIAVKMTMGETGDNGVVKVMIVNSTTGYAWQLGTWGNRIDEYFLNSHLTSVPVGTVIWFSFASDGMNLMTCMIPDSPQTLRLNGTLNSAPWPPAGLDCSEQAANVPANLPDRSATTSINQIVFSSSSTSTVVNGFYLSSGSLDGPTDSRMLPPMVLNATIGLDTYNGSRVGSYLGNIPTLTQIFVPGAYGTPDRTPIVLMHHPYGNISLPLMAQSTMAALFNDGYMVVMPGAIANYGGGSDYMNPLASNWGAPSGLLIRKQAVDWVRQNLPAAWQLYQFGTSMGCINSLEYEKWWPGSAAIGCVSGVTSLAVADSPPYGTGQISSIDATSFSGFYVALQGGTGQNPSSSANFWKQISVAPGFMDEMYLHNPPYNFADTWSTTRTYSTGQIVALPYAGSLASLAPYDPTLNPQTYASVPISMSVCNVDQPFAAENQAFYDALHAIGGDVTLRIVSDGTCSHQSADLFFPSATVSFFDQYRYRSASGSSGTTPPPAATTATTLSITSAGSAAATVAAGSSVTLTAAVKAGGTPVTAGQVRFCDSDPSQCTGIHVVGTAQLTSSGNAAVNLVPPIGIHSYTAIFAGTALYSSSSSSAASLTVTGLYPTATTVAQSGSAGSYALTATVTGTGATSAPSGTVSFLDGSDGNNVLATVVLGSGAPNLGWVNSQTPGTGQGPGSAVTADFNGDGRPDLAVANLNGNSVTILLGRGDGTFSPGPVVATGNGPDALAAGDVNGDGKPDLAVANFQDNSVTLLLGNGDGTFAAAANVATGVHPAAVAAGDFNGDGNLDLAVANSGDSTITVLLGSGLGTFTKTASVPATGIYPDSIAVGDFDGDGDLDLAVANGGSNSITVLRGNGDGSFTPAASPRTGSQPVWVTAADFNRDGAVDLAVVNYADSTITVLLGVGDATFAAAPSLLTGANPDYAAALDFDRDGNPDLAVATSAANSATLLLGKGDGTFAPFATSPATGSFSNSVAVADFDSDGGPDLAISNFRDSTVTVLLSQLTATSASSATGIGPLGTGIHLVRATYSGDGNYFGSASSDVGLAARQITPALTWGAPAAIAYGTPLSASILNASSTVSGAYTYSPALGAVLSAGSHTLTVTFTPDDLTHCTTATATVALMVNQAAPAIAWAAPAPITYGTALSAAQLNAGSTVSGTYSYSPVLGTVLSAGSNTLSVTFTPDDIADYTRATGTVTLTVNRAAPAITWVAPAASTYGTALSAAQLNATSTVAGTFAYSPALGTVLPAGSHTLSVTFTPDDTADYTTATSSVTLAVNQATPAITWTSSAAMTYGTALSAAQLNATSTVAGTFAYSPALGTVLPAGSHTLSVTFTPADTADYTTATTSVTLAVNQATPAITWTSPAAMTYGTALSAVQLNAGSTVAGTFAYSPALGTVLPAGSHTLSVTFTPADTADYTTATTSVTLAVNQATPAITWTSPAAMTYGTALSAAQLNASSTVAGTFAYSPAPGTVLPAGSQTLSVTFTPADTADYTTATAFVTLAVNKAAQTITLTPLPSALAFGSAAIPVTATSSSGLPVALSATGPASLNGRALAIVGTGTVMVTASQTGDANYSPATPVAETIDVTKASPTVALTASSASVIDGSPVTFIAMVTCTGATPTGMVTFYSGTTVLGTAALDGSGTAKLTVNSLGIGSSVETVSYAGDGNFASAVSPAVGVSVLPKSIPAITLTSSANSIIAGIPVTLTATVTGTGANPQAAPTGTVLFANGGSTLGAVTLGGGVATLEVTSLPLGSANITAAYAGDSNFAAATSSALPITVTAPVVDFTVAASPSSRTVYMGQAASYTITVTPVSGSMLPVTLSCSQLPAGASCSFSPVTGDHSASSTLVVQTAAANGGATASLFSSRSKGMALAALLLFFLPLRLGRLRKRWPAFFIALALLAAGSSAISGCGGTYSISSGTPAGAQSITVAAAANNGSQVVMHEVVLTLNIMAPK